MYIQPWGEEASKYLLTDAAPAYHRGVHLRMALCACSFLLCDTGNSTSEFLLPARLRMANGGQGAGRGCVASWGELIVRKCGFWSK